jgi:hypothetical protein
LAVIGPHADSTMVGFPHYTYPAVLPMLAAALKLGMFPMPGVGEVPKEGMALLQTEFDGAGGRDLEQYARKEYGALSLAEAIQKLLPNAQVTAVAGTGVTPAQPTDIPQAVAGAKAADLVILYVGGAAGWVGDNLTEKEGGDTANIDLPPQQVQLVNAIAALGKPTVAVVAMGRPQGLAPVIDKLRPSSRPITAVRIRAPRSPTPSSASRTRAANCRSRSRVTPGRCPSITGRRTAAATVGPRPTSTGAIWTCRRRRCSRSATDSATRPSSTAR